MAGEIKTWLRPFLNPKDVSEIEAAVQAGEAKTQGEIVPMIVRSSSTKGFLPTLIFLLMLPVILIFWDHHHWWMPLAAMLIARILASFVAEFHWVQRALIPKDDQVSDVFHRAHFEFHNHGLGQTKERTGILLFVSLMEHRCVVLADQGIAARVDEKIWDEVVALLISHIKKGEAGEGFEKAIQKCSEILAQHLPAQAQNPNELRNHLIIKD